VAVEGSRELDSFDLVVIGCGPAGEKGAAQAAYFGRRVAVVERRPQLGGAAFTVSGVPVKTLRATAMYLTGWSRRDVYGVGMDLSPELVMNRIRERVNDVVASMTTAVGANLARHGIELIRGDARLGQDRTVVVQTEDAGERVLHAEVILLATGSHPHHPIDVPFEDAEVHDSETVLTMGRMPQHMMVVGGGPVGCEYASIFATLGVKVTLVDRGTRLLPLLDAEMSAVLAAVLKRSGVEIHLQAQVDSVTRDADGLLVRVGGESFRPQLMVHAVGREGNVEGLGLTEAGVETEARGRVRVDGRFQTTAPGIYAAGDIIGPPGLSSVGMEQARVAMCRAFNIPFKEGVDRAVPAGIFTLPEVSMVGMTEEGARAAGEDVETGRASFDANARARISGSTDGLVKLVFRQNDKRLLGAHIVGDEATELIHIAQAVLHKGGAIDDFIDTAFNFPTRADAYKYAAYDGLQRLAAGRVATQ
jgi:NAD(P) transhydrogenase